MTVLLDDDNADSDVPLLRAARRRLATEWFSNNFQNRGSSGGANFVAASLSQAVAHSESSRLPISMQIAPLNGGCFGFQQYIFALCLSHVKCSSKASCFLRRSFAS